MSKSALVLCMTGFFLGLAGAAGCSKEEPPPPYKPREAPRFDEPAATTGPAVEGAPGLSAELPPGHPPISQPAGAAALPPGHPPTTAPEGGAELSFEIPAGWASKPARFMTTQVFAAPKADPDKEDADVAVSLLDNVVPLQMNVERWCTQFDLAQGQTCAQAAKQRKIEGTKYPSTLVEISGAYKGGSMFAPPGPAKPDYKMVAAEILPPGRPYYVKMVGPAKTVDRWKDDFMKMVRSAK